ncbi:MerR family transcriptional regulator [Kribbella pittospori]|uniref:MerR family transcriptional regulator n=1 Tax=Kribbella pittospori TaxID=722689 RepID=A0A4R0K496_9ACTN|nr:zinc-binding dehydrogenase [Kribbella pittospori]TCC54863.1 MerR family transcriptional regulator [Kribbella pittospori]
MTTPVAGQEIRLKRRPTSTSLPGIEDFQLADQAVGSPRRGEVLVQNLFLSLDPMMLALIQGRPGLPMPAYEVGQVMYGAAVGRVLESGDPSLWPGDLVVHQFGWRQYAIAPAGRVRKVDDLNASPSAHLASGVVAYAGFRLAGLREGDTVYVSSAAGAVGSLAGQLAKLLGAGLVVGSTGSAGKVARVRELGYDAAFVHHDGPIADQLRVAAPDGIDCYLDLAGGNHLAAAVEVMNPRGRIALCGALEQQLTGVPGPGLDAFQLIAKQLTVRGLHDRRTRRPRSGVRAAVPRLVTRRFSPPHRECGRRPGERTGRAARTAGRPENREDSRAGLTLDPGVMIGELARRTGTTTRTLRFYEEQGLLESDRSGNGYRRYAPDAEVQVRRIRDLLALGFTVGDVHDLIGYLDRDLPEVFEPAPCCAEGFVIGAARVADLTERIDALTVLREKLLGKMPWLRT